MTTPLISARKKLAALRPIRLCLEIASGAVFMAPFSSPFGKATERKD
jgi:hypothetical protein